MGTVLLKELAVEIDDLIEGFSNTRKRQGQGIFTSLFILSNRLQALFDEHIPEVTLKQFILLAIVNQADAPATLTHMAGILRCSRQNVTKLARALERKGFARISRNPNDPRALCIVLTDRAREFLDRDFTRYRDGLDELFGVYTDEEMETLYGLIMRLHTGVERLEGTATPGGPARQGDPDATE